MTCHIFFNVFFEVCYYILIKRYTKEFKLFPEKLKHFREMPYVKGQSLREQTQY